MINHSQFCFRGIFWLCHKKLHLTQLGVQLLGCSPMYEQGFKFFQADNGVWLTDTVPYRFIQE
jgi:RNA:NAD 2'-phosphotransferase (TPT1/KptA family)